MAGITQEQMAAFFRALFAPGPVIKPQNCSPEECKENKRRHDDWVKREKERIEKMRAKYAKLNNKAA